MASYGPSAFQLQRATSTLREACALLSAADPEAEDAYIADILGSDPETCEGMELVHAVARAVVATEDLAAAAKIRRAAISARQARFEARAERLRDALLVAMQTIGLRRIELPDLTITTREHQPGIVVTDEAAIPDVFARYERSISRSAIREALKNGEVIPGAGWANARSSVQIRTS